MAQSQYKALWPTRQTLGDWLNAAVRTARYITADGPDEAVVLRNRGDGVPPERVAPRNRPLLSGRRHDVPCRSSCTASTGPRCRVRGAAPTTRPGHRRRSARTAPTYC